MNIFNIALIAVGICAVVILISNIKEAWESGKKDKGMYINHEELGKMREEWIEFGRKLEKLGKK